jgi:hypothetical protein
MKMAGKRMFSEPQTSEPRVPLLIWVKKNSYGLSATHFSEPRAKIHVANVEKSGGHAKMMSFTKDTTAATIHGGRRAGRKFWGVYVYYPKQKR